MSLNTSSFHPINLTEINASFHLPSPQGLQRANAHSYPVEDGTSSSSLPLLVLNDPLEDLNPLPSYQPNSVDNSPVPKRRKYELIQAEALPVVLWQNLIFSYLDTRASAAVCQVNKFFRSNAYYNPVFALDVLVEKLSYKIFSHEDIRNRLISIKLPTAVKKADFRKRFVNQFKAEINGGELSSFFDCAFKLFSEDNQNYNPWIQFVNNYAISVLKKLYYEDEFIQLRCYESHYFNLKKANKESEFKVNQVLISKGLGERIIHQLNVKYALLTNSKWEFPKELRSDREFLLFAVKEFFPESIIENGIASSFAFLRDMDESLKNESFWLEMIQNNHQVYPFVDENIKTEEFFLKALKKNPFMIFNLGLNKAWDCSDDVLDAVWEYAELMVKVTDGFPVDNIYYHKNCIYYALQFLISSTCGDYDFEFVDDYKPLVINYALFLIRHKDNIMAGFKRIHQTPMEFSSTSCREMKMLLPPCLKTDADFKFKMLKIDFMFNDYFEEGLIRKTDFENETALKPSKHSILNFVQIEVNRVDMRTDREKMNDDLRKKGLLLREKHQHLPALECFIRAYEKGDIESGIYLTCMIIDLSDPASVFEKFSKQMNSFGRLGLALCYAKGIGTQIDLEKVKQLVGQIDNDYRPLNIGQPLLNYTKRILNIVNKKERRNFELKHRIMV